MTTINYILGIFSWIVSIFSLNITTLDGNTTSIEQYKGKKILLVNIATQSPYATTQLPELEQFYQTHKDSVVVIGFASNSFGNEPLSNTELKSVLQGSYHISFPIVERTDVIGANAHEVYQWLESKTQNGVTDAKVKGDFQKFLINKNGELAGMFSSKTSVTGNIIQTAIQY